MATSTANRFREIAGYISLTCCLGIWLIASFGNTYFGKLNGGLVPLYAAIGTYLFIAVVGYLCGLEALRSKSAFNKTCGILGLIAMTILLKVMFLTPISR